MVFYEVLAGRRPFDGSSTADAFMAILKGEPDLSILPGRARAVVDKALEKNREERYSAAAELLEDVASLNNGHRVWFARRIGARRRVTGSGLRRLAMPGALLVLLFAGLTGGSYFYLNGSEQFEIQRVERITSSGNISATAISPDGHYVAYGAGDSNQEELRLQQVGVVGAISRLPKERGEISGVTFSPDNQYIYFIRQKQEFGRLYRIPILAGDAQFIADNVDTPVSFSPDGQRIAYIRGDSASSEFSLLTQDAEHEGPETKVALRRPPVYLAFTSPTWSPDGRSILYAEYRPTGRGMQTRLIQMELATRQERHVGPQNWYMIGRPAWLRGGPQVAVPAMPIGGIESSLYLLSLESQKATGLRVDPGSYGDLSATADAKVLAAVQADRISDICVLPAGDPTNVHRLQTWAGRFRGIA